MSESLTKSKIRVHEHVRTTCNIVVAIATVAIAVVAYQGLLVPEAPTNLTAKRTFAQVTGEIDLQSATEDYSSKVELNWDYPRQQGFGGFHVLRRIKSTHEVGVFERIKFVKPNRRSHTDKDCPEEKTCVYRVIAVTGFFQDIKSEWSNFIRCDASDEGTITNNGNECVYES